MIQLTQDDIKDIKITARLILAECLSRGWDVYALDIGSPHLYIDRKDGKEKIHLYSSTPPTTSFAAAKLANNKYEAYVTMKNHELPVLETVVYDTNSVLTIEQWMRDGSVVVKPNEGAHGYGITTHINNKEQLDRAVLGAKSAFTDDGKIIVQKMYQNPVDIRILCINYKFVSAVHRIAARVTGSGIHTVEQLIIQENSSKRGKSYESTLAQIDVEKARQFLAEKMNNVPAVNEVVTVIGTANMGTGGESSEISHTIPNWLIDIAQKCARAVNLPVCGVDFMLKEIPTKASYITDLNPIITEVNKCPSFGLHDQPIYGTPSNATITFLDYINIL